MVVNKTIGILGILIFIMSCSNDKRNLVVSNVTKKDIVATNHIEYPFDSILESCLDSGENRGNTMGEIECYYDAAIKLDTLIDKYYHILFKKLDKSDRYKLKVSQDKWLQYYHAESKFIYSAFYTWSNFSKYGHGREAAIDQAQWRYELARKRLVDLIKYDSQIVNVSDQN